MKFHTRGVSALAPRLPPWRVPRVFLAKNPSKNKHLMGAFIGGAKLGHTKVAGRVLICLPAALYAAVFYPATAKPANLELGVSYTRIELVAPGFWYDPDKPHIIERNKTGFEVGVRSGAWGLDFIRSGNFKSDAIAIGANGQPARFEGHGWFGGIQVKRNWNWVSGGLLYYRARWFEDTAQDGHYGHYSNVPNLHIAPIFGLVHSFGSWNLELSATPMCLSDRCKTGVYPPIWRTPYTLTIKKSL